MTEPFVWLLKKLIERHRDDLEEIKTMLKVRRDAKSYDLAILIRLLNMPVKWGIEILPLQKDSERRVRGALKRVDKITKERWWLEIKSRV